MNNGKSCCNSKAKQKEPKGFWQGLLYGLLPHTGCIAFIVFTLIGVTAATTVFRSLLLNKYFFFILIGISVLLAAVSAMIYLKQLHMLSVNGAKRKWRYLSILFGTTIIINVLFFTVIFPAVAAKMSSSPISQQPGYENAILNVAIPCSGHAPLIIEELKKNAGIIGVQSIGNNKFNVTYDSGKTNLSQILSMDIFTTYPATQI